jgi:hypothetical protein
MINGCATRGTRTNWHKWQTEQAVQVSGSKLLGDIANPLKTRQLT